MFRDRARWSRSCVRRVRCVRHRYDRRETRLASRRHRRVLPTDSACSARAVRQAANASSHWILAILRQVSVPQRARRAAEQHLAPPQQISFSAFLWAFRLFSVVVAKRLRVSALRAAVAQPSRLAFPARVRSPVRNLIRRHIGWRDFGRCGDRREIDHHDWRTRAWIGALAPFHQQGRRAGAMNTERQREAGAPQQKFVAARLHCLSPSSPTNAMCR